MARYILQNRIESINRRFGEYIKVERFLKFNVHRLQGLNNLLTKESPIISKGLKQHLNKTLKKDPQDYLIVIVKNKEVMPREFKKLMYAGDMDKNNPSNIKELDLPGFYFLAYGIQMLYTDRISFYIIINKNDILNLAKLYKKAIHKFNWDYEGHLAEIENDYRDVIYHMEEQGIKSTIDYENIFQLKERHRKNFFIFIKKCGITKRERTLLKEIRKAEGGKPFYVYKEELEEELEKIRGLQRPLELLEHQEAERKERELEIKYWRTEEENNNWKDIVTTLEDYYKPVNLNPRKNKK